MSRILFAAFFFTLTLSALGQSQAPRPGQPDLPGGLYFDAGLGLLLDAPGELDHSLIGSNVLNVSYFYDIQIAGSKFHFVPGISYSNERFRLSDELYMAPTADGTLVFDRTVNQVANYTGGVRGNTDVGLQYIPGTIGTDTDATPSKAKLINQYFDVPLELRFYSNPERLTSSFMVAVGVKAGVLVQSSFKSKYDAQGTTLKDRMSTDLGVSQLRYGATFRIGMGRFNAWAYYALSPLFSANLRLANIETAGGVGSEREFRINDGELSTTQLADDFTPLQFGFSLNLF